MRENKKKSFRCGPTRPVIENSRKMAKKFKKLENTIKASFQAKIGCKRLRNRENKNKKSFRCVPTRPGIENSKNKSKKIQKIKKKKHDDFFSCQDRLRKIEKEI